MLLDLEDREKKQRQNRTERKKSIFYSQRDLMTKSFFYTNARNIQSIIHESGFTLKYVKTTLSINVCGGEN